MIVDEASEVERIEEEPKDSKSVEEAESVNVEAKEIKGEEEIPPDYDKFEPVTLDWLKAKFKDSEVVLISVEELKESDAFFEKYDIAEDMVIVCHLESKEDEFATLLFDKPFSGLSTKEVFIWEEFERCILRETHSF